MESKRTSIVLTIIVVIIFMYLQIASSIAKPQIDIWVYNEIFPFALVSYVLIVFLIGFLSDLSLRARIITVSVILPTLHVLTPLVKYSSKFYNPFDTQSHIIFSRWIAQNGRIPIAGEVYYSRDYGYTPLGNGVLPAVLELVSNIDIQDVHTILFVMYLAVFILTVLSIGRIRHGLYVHGGSHGVFWSFSVYVLLLSTLYLPEWWGSPVFASISACLVIYTVHLFVTNKNWSLVNVVPSILIYVSLILTHILISLHIITVLFLALILLFIFCFSKTTKSVNECKRMSLILGVFVILYLTFNVYYVITWRDYIVYLYNKVFGIPEPLLPEEMSLYIQRAPEPTKVLLIGIGAYGKMLTVMFLNIIVSLNILIKRIVKRVASRNNGSNDEKLLESLFIGTLIVNVSTITLFFNRIEAITRSIVLNECVLIGLLSYRLSTTHNMPTLLLRISKYKLTMIFAAVLVCSSALMNIANYGIPAIIPETRVHTNDKELAFTSYIRTYVASSLLISSAQFVGEGVLEYMGIIISPFYPRNYVDYFWDKTERREIFGNLLFVDELEKKIIESILKIRAQCVVVPLAISWKYVPIGSINLDYPFIEMHVRLTSKYDLIYDNPGVRIYLAAST